MEEVHLTTIKPKNQVLLLAQEIAFVKVLACNDKRLRDRGVRRLKKWFLARSQGSMEFTEEDFLRIWKGLFYCMWMSDKPLVQEELAEEISNLIHSFATFKASILFVKTFFASLSVEWPGIDQLRLDKFMMLVRRFMRQSFELVAHIEWPKKEVQQLADVYYNTLSTAPLGLSMHITEVFCEELAKVGQGKLSSSTILQFITIFAKVMASLKDGRFISQITRCVFLHLIRQTELGIEHQMKFSAWKEYGFPGGDVDAAEKVEIDSDEESVEVECEMEHDDEEEEREVGIDARAGKVDVLLPPLDFDPRDLLKVLRDLRNKKETTTKARKTLIQLITKYEDLAAGKYPLGLHKVNLPSKIDKKKELVKAAKRLIIEEEKLLSEKDDESEIPLKQKKKNKKPLKLQAKSVWEVSDSKENTSDSDSEKNKSWEISETKDKVTKKKDHSKKRKIDNEENKSSVNSSKKIKLSQFSVSDIEEKHFSISETSTPKTAHLKHNSSQFSVSESKDDNVEIQDSKSQMKKKHKKNVLKKASSENIIKNSTSNESHLKGDINQNNNKNTPTETEGQVSVISDSKEIQSPEVDSTTNTPENSHNSKNEKDETNIQLNTSTTKKNNGWGGEWDMESENLEYEIFIPNKKYVEKRKSLGLPYPVSSFVQKSAEKLTPVNKIKRELRAKSATPGSQKKVEFNLSANQSQEYKEYTKNLKVSKSKVPFDATKKPVQGLLKNSTPSPINPFYKKTLNFLKSPVSTP